MKNPASVRLNVRLTPAELERYKTTAKRAGVSLSVWLKAMATIGTVADDWQSRHGDSSYPIRLSIVCSEDKT